MLQRKAPKTKRISFREPPFHIAARDPRNTSRRHALLLLVLPVPLVLLLVSSLVLPVLPLVLLLLLPVLVFPRGSVYGPPSVAEGEVAMEAEAKAGERAVW